MTPKQFVKAYKKHGSVKAVSRQEGMSYRQARKAYLAAVAEGLMDPQPVGAKPREENKEPVIQFEGRIKALPTRSLHIPEKGVRRHIFTSAQSNSMVFEPFWENLKVLAEHYDADIHVARYTYVKSGLGARGDKAQVVKREKLEDGTTLTWPTELEPYFSDQRMEVAPGLVWCGEMNILPTAVNPLSGLEVYTGRKSAIIPHAKLAMQSIPSARHEPPKFNYTTGTVTMRNYIQRKAGLKAEFHHCYGALLVEVDSDGDWFCRQINADSNGRIYDLDVCVHNKKLTTGNRVEAVNWGDIHTEEMDPLVAYLAWGLGDPEKHEGVRYDPMIDALRPQYQFMHDVVTFMGPSHHNLKDPYVMFRRKLSGHLNVRDEFARAGDFLKVVHRSFCNTISVDSNHHHHMARWLKEQDARRDPSNVEYWMDLQVASYEHLRKYDEEPNYLKMGMALAGHPDIESYVRFLDDDESFIICHDRNGGIECGMHGDRGPNGSRGSTRAYARMGRKMNKGHDHMATIFEGVYSAGTCSRLALDWNRGPSGWSHSHIVTYANGKRAIITMFNGKWRASA